jgi:hypothetical protein
MLLRVLRTGINWGNLHLVGSDLSILEVTESGDGGDGESSNETEELDLHVCGWFCEER